MFTLPTQCALKGLPTKIVWHLLKCIWKSFIWTKYSSLTRKNTLRLSWHATIITTHKLPTQYEFSGVKNQIIVIVSNRTFCIYLPFKAAEKRTAHSFEHFFFLWILSKVTENNFLIFLICKKLFHQNWWCNWIDEIQNWCWFDTRAYLWQEWLYSTSFLWENFY